MDPNLCKPCWYLIQERGHTLFIVFPACIFFFSESWHTNFHLLGATFFFQLYLVLSFFSLHFSSVQLSYVRTSLDVMDKSVTGASDSRPEVSDAEYAQGRHGLIQSLELLTANSRCRTQSRWSSSIWIFLLPLGSPSVTPRPPIH